MKLTKAFKSYLAIWAILLAVFNVICFVIPAVNSETEKYTTQFWIGYVFITAAFIGQLVCAAVALKDGTSSHLFYNIPLIRVSYIGLILTLIVGGLFMAIPKVPNWIGVILCVLVLAFTAVAVIKAGTAAAIVEGVDKKVKTKTAFIRMLTVDADSLTARAKTDDAKTACRKVFEAVRYSDPMSDPALGGVEDKITAAFGALTEAVENGADNVGEVADEVVALVTERNKKCKVLK